MAAGERRLTALPGDLLRLEVALRACCCLRCLLLLLASSELNGLYRRRLLGSGAEAPASSIFIEKEVTA